MELNLTTFEVAIKNYLDNRAKEDATFAVTYAKENKSIKECCQYIYGEVGKARSKGAQCVALSDEDVFGLAVHYYDEDDIAIASDVAKPTVVQVQSIESSPKETLKQRKPRKSKAQISEPDVDPNIPEPFDMPLF